MAEPVVIVVGRDEDPAGARVWGTGGWTHPAEREARDWLTICRLLGWGVQLASPKLAALSAETRWTVLACPPDEVDERLAWQIHRRLEEEPLLVVAKAGMPHVAGVAAASERIAGRELAWIGPGAKTASTLRADLSAVSVDVAGGDAWLALDGAPVAAAVRVGRGTVVSVGFQPSEAHAAGGAGTAALRRILLEGVPGPVAWLDHHGVLALRMDDPGGSQNVHLKTWEYRELGADIWAEVAEDLRGRGARLTVAAVPGWVDDGDPGRGDLLVGERPVDRLPGKVHPSWDVVYRPKDGAESDYAGEFALLRELHAEGVIDPQLHGHTHIRPPLGDWARAPDRYRSVEWFREFSGAPPSTEPGPLAQGFEMLSAFFGKAPSVVVFPGDEWTEAALERALDLGLEAVSSYYLAIRDDDRFCWCEHVCAPYLDQPDPSWFEAGVPVVGYFHAYDLAHGGANWMLRALDGWTRAGACRLVGLGDLAFAVATRVRIHDTGSGPRVSIDTPEGSGQLRIAVRGLDLDRTDLELTVNDERVRHPVSSIAPGVLCVDLCFRS